MNFSTELHSNLFYGPQEFSYKCNAVTDSRIAWINLKSKNECVRIGDSTASGAL